MKVINLTNLTKKEKELALGEPEILKKYDHLNMVKYIKDFQTSCKGFEYLCIVMEFIEGKTLRQLVEEYKQDGKRLKIETIFGFFV